MSSRKNQHIMEGIAARAGVGEKPNEYTGLTLKEVANRVGVPFDRSGMPMMAAGGQSTSDFGHILENVARKAMLKGFTEVDETFESWTSRGTLPDFKPQDRVDLGLFPTLDHVPEGAEYRYATLGDRKETVQLATYGRAFSITRQAIVNDDLNALVRLPQRMGRAAGRTVGDLVYAILTGNPLMSDGVALFDAAHGNVSAAPGAPSVPTIDAARTAMATQELDDAPVGIRPKYLICPVALEGAARVVLNSEFDHSEDGKTNKPNMVRNLATVISDARLDRASPTTWYMAADPNTVDTIEVLYLNGVSEPELMRRTAWTTDGAEFKVRLDAGVKALDWRGLYRNA